MYRPKTGLAVPVCELKENYDHQWDLEGTGNAFSDVSPCVYVNIFQAICLPQIAYWNIKNLELFT